MSWSLYLNDNNGEIKSLPPLKFSNGKSQEDIVNEIISAIQKGHKVIFVKGVCGTGKSAISLNLAKNLGRSSIIVPIKALQNQYEEDYTNKMYLMKDNGEKFKIQIIKGRKNFTCPFLLEQDKLIKEGFELKEKNTLQDTILDDFDKKNICSMENSKKIDKRENSCDNSILPCKIEIKDKNSRQIREYLKRNPKINHSLFSSLKGIRRISIAPICPYWSPMVPSEVDFSILKDASIKIYNGLKNRSYSIYKRKSGCGYYDQYLAYLNADAIVFNSHKYKIETAMNRKPATSVEIIDECDEFLDSFSNEEEINLNKLNFALGGLFAENAKDSETINELISLSSDLIKECQRKFSEADILPLKDTKVYSLLKKFLDSAIMDSVECDEENYCYHAENTARIFEDFFEETYISFRKKEKNFFVEMVTTNLEKRFKDLLEKNKALVLMSGTLHSENVLKNVFGISDFKIIEAETETPGKIIPVKTGLEINCKYSNFQTGKFSRKQYLEALAKCIAEAKRPLLIHVNAYSDLPSKHEAEEYNLNILTREEFRNIQSKKNSYTLVDDFKKGKMDVLYSTVCNRGADFPGETCNSIILTKYPYPAVNSIFWKVLKKTRPEYYDAFYLDKAKREFLQKIYRGLRFKEDKVFILSPDIRVFQALEKI